MDWWTRLRNMAPQKLRPQEAFLLARAVQHCSGDIGRDGFRDLLDHYLHRKRWPFDPSDAAAHLEMLTRLVDDTFGGEWGSETRSLRRKLQPHP